MVSKQREAANSTPPWYAWIAAVGILIAAGAALFRLTGTDSVTFDERIHLAAGYAYVVDGDPQYNPEHPPLAKLLMGAGVALVPNLTAPEKVPDQIAYGEDLLFHSGNDAEQVLRYARIPLVVITLILFLLVGLWAGALWGWQGGLAALALAASCPILLAHGHLANTDVLFGAGFFTNFVALYFWLKRPSALITVLWGMTIGIALAAKFSGPTVVALNVVLLVIYIATERPNPKRRSSILWQALLAHLLGGIFLWAFYILSIRGALAGSELGSWLTAPIHEYLKGFAMVSDHNRYGHTAYLLGEWSNRGRWQYFLVALWYKVPIPALLLTAVGLITVLRHRTLRAWEKTLLVLPAALYLALSMASNLNIGVRHLMPLFPFFYLWAGSTVAQIRSRGVRIAAWLLVLLNVLIAWQAYPHYLSYFNRPLSGTPPISDSNYDWGQNMERLAEYLQERGVDTIYFRCYDSGQLGYYGITTQPIPETNPGSGIVVMCLDHYLLTRSDDIYQWFIGHEPEVVAHTYRIWNLDALP